jgi:hypothetical protein
VTNVSNECAMKGEDVGLKITVETPESSELLSPYELEVGEWVYASDQEPGVDSLRLVLEDRVVDIYGKYTAVKDSPVKFYRRLPVGTKIVLAVTK